METRKDTYERITKIKRCEKNEEDKIYGIFPRPSSMLSDENPDKDQNRTKKETASSKDSNIQLQ